MTAGTIGSLVWLAGCIQAGILLGNIPLPRRLRVREKLASVPGFLRQIFYVHWFFIVLVVALFSLVCFAFGPDLSGGSELGRFLSAFMAVFWFIRIILQWFYYDRQMRRENRWLDTAYNVALVALVAIFTLAAAGSRTP
jgi:energy-coupling factor transporter transmembrane protein EcfT